MGGKVTEESAAKNYKWSKEETKESASEEEAETAERGGGGQNDADGNIKGIIGKRHRRRTRGISSRRGRHLGRHLRGSGRIRSGRPPWVRKTGMGEDCRTARKPGQQVLRREI